VIEDKRSRTAQGVAAERPHAGLVDTSVAVDLVVSSGLSVDQVTTMSEAARTLVPSSAHLRVKEVSDRKTLVAAVLDH
jgi:K+-transporting ATPase c subunit